MPDQEGRIHVFDPDMLDPEVLDEARPASRHMVKDIERRVVAMERRWDEFDRLKKSVVKWVVLAAFAGGTLGSEGARAFVDVVLVLLGMTR